MMILDTIDALRNALTPHRQAGRRIGFVPTMGALHEGHRSLIRRARAKCDVVVVSIFVNPTQFGPGEDFEAYPRPETADLDACRAESADAVFLPPVDQMYPPDDATTVSVARLTDVLCGPRRPGHFDGVTTVVAKLFNAVQPDAAYFGQKDAQQAIVLRRMVRDLLWPIEMVICPTVREPDGLAMSSRNAYLTAEQRQQALCLSKALTWATEQIAAGQRESAAIVAGMTEQIEAAGPCTIEYIAIHDAENLSGKPHLDGRCLIALAVRIGPARLIDNVVVDVASGAG